MAATCQSCPWWTTPRDFDLPTGIAGQRYTGTLGTCKRMPPTRSTHQHAMQMVVGNGEWPQTSSGDWCGEHPDRGGRKPGIHYNIPRETALQIKGWVDKFLTEIPA